MPFIMDDIEAAVNALGVEKLGIVMDIANTDWESTEQRDSFLRALKEAK